MADPKVASSVTLTPADHGEYASVARNDHPSGYELAAIANLAIRVGRGTATIKELSDRLAPYGVRRKV